MGELLNGDVLGSRNAKRTNNLYGGVTEDSHEGLGSMLCRIVNLGSMGLWVHGTDCHKYNRHFIDSGVPT